MPRTTLEPRYFDRMDAALDDKIQLTDHLVDGTVADVGAGSGQLSAAIAAHPGITGVYAIDNSVDAMRLLHEHKTITALHGSFERLADIAAPLDNIVLSSVMHEVWSYGGEDTYAHWRAWRQAINACVDALALGGRLIIRDGVRPRIARFGGQHTLTAPDVSADQLMERYTELSPFPVVPRRGAGFLEWTGAAEVLAEALLTVNWGPEALPREAQERFMLAGADEYAAAVLDGRRLNLVAQRAYTQLGYVHALSGWTLTDPQGREWFPETNAIWVFERTE